MPIECHRNFQERKVEGLKWMRRDINTKSTRSQASRKELDALRNNYRIFSMRSSLLGKMTKVRGHDLYHVTPGDLLTRYSERQCTRFFYDLAFKMLYCIVVVVRFPSFPAFISFISIMFSIRTVRVCITPLTPPQSYHF